jgi:hypothetical protein
MLILLYILLEMNCDMVNVHKIGYWILSMNLGKEIP